MNGISNGQTGVKEHARPFKGIPIDQLAHNRDQPALTADGTELELLGNINGVSDAEAAVAMGASGVGLYRTEYLFLTHPSVPDEEEQVAIYKAVIAASPNRTVTIRTLDIGGDKTVPFLGRTHHEANPFMGWRSIRLSFEHPQFFMTQIDHDILSGFDVAAIAHGVVAAPVQFDKAAGHERALRYTDLSNQLLQVLLLGIDRLVRLRRRLQHD